MVFSPLFAFHHLNFPPIFTVKPVHHPFPLSPPRPPIPPPSPNLLTCIVGMYNSPITFATSLLLVLSFRSFYVVGKLVLASFFLRCPPLTVMEVSPTVNHSRLPSLWNPSFLASFVFFHSRSCVNVDFGCMFCCGTSPDLLTPSLPRFLILSLVVSSNSAFKPDRSPFSAGIEFVLSTSF